MSDFDQWAGFTAQQPVKAQQNNSDFDSWAGLNLPQQANQQNIAPIINQQQGMLDNLGNFKDAAIHHIVNALHGGAQLIENGLASGASQLPDNPVSKYIIDAANKDNQAIADRENNYQKNVPNNPYSYAGAVTGEVLPFMVGGGAKAINSIGNATQTLTRNIPRIGQILSKGAAEGAAASAIQPVVNNKDYWSGKKDQLESGSEFGAGGALFGRALSRVISPQTSNDARLLLNEGVNLTPGQILGGSLGRMEEGLESLPIGGDFIKSAKNRSNISLNTAALNRALSPIGESIPQNMNGRNAMDYTHQRISDQYNNFINNSSPIKVDNQFNNGISNVKGMAGLLPGETGKQLLALLDHHIESRVDQYGNFTPEQFKNADSLLRETSQRYGRSSNADHYQISQGLAESRNLLHDLLERSNPNDSEKYRNIRTAFANYLRPQRASTSLGAENGIFTPPQLQNAVKVLDNTKRKTGFSEGDALMQDLSEAAKNVMGSKTPDSGTAFRSAMQSPTKSLIFSPASAAMGLVYSPLGQRLSQSALTQRPNFAPTLANHTNNNAAILAGLLGANYNNNKDKK